MSNANNQHQISNVTGFDRYPPIFKECALYFKGRDRLKILSFGCSTGKECLSLIKYFPSAKILGYDINKNNIDIAKENNNPRVSFTSDINEVIKEGPFDAIFYMSVLCRWPQTKGCDDSKDIYPFDMFNELLKNNDSMLKQSGLIVIYNSNYRFCDSDIFNKYEVLKSNSIKESGGVYKFSKNNKKLNGIDYPDCIFIKKY